MASQANNSNPISSVAAKARLYLHNANRNSLAVSSTTFLNFSNEKNFPNSSSSENLEQLASSSSSCTTSPAQSPRLALNNNLLASSNFPSGNSSNVNNSVNNNVNNNLSVANASSSHPSLLSNTRVCNDIIRLNIGGYIYTTTLDILTKPLYNYSAEPHFFQQLLGSYSSASSSSGYYSHVQAQASKKRLSNNNNNYFTRFQIETDEQGNVFIDRDGKHFRYILNYLRKGGVMSHCIFPVNDYLAMEELLNEAEFYGLTRLTNFFRQPYKVVFAPPSLDYNNQGNNNSGSSNNSSGGISVTPDRRCMQLSHGTKVTQLRTAKPLIVNKGVITERIAHQYNSVMFNFQMDAKIKIQTLDQNQYNEVAFTIAYISSFNNYIRIQIWLDIPNDKIVWQYTDKDLKVTTFSDYLPYMDPNKEWYFTVCDLNASGAHMGSIEVRTADLKKHAVFEK